MVIGLYGVLYLEVARRPEHGWLIAAVGLTGKILGPIGLAIELARGTWPLAVALICVTNDFIWWIPFRCYLRDAWPHFRRTFGALRTKNPLALHPADEGGQLPRPALCSRAGEEVIL